MQATHQLPDDCPSVQHPQHLPKHSSPAAYYRRRPSTSNHMEALQETPAVSEAAGCWCLTVTGTTLYPLMYRLTYRDVYGNIAAHAYLGHAHPSGRAAPGFLPIAGAADSASAESMDHVDRQQQLFHRRSARAAARKIAAFRAWMQDHQPDWAEAHRAPGRIGEPDQVWSACQAPWPSAEGYRVVWIHDSGKQLRDAAARARKIEKGVQAMKDDLAGRLSSPRTRLRTAAAVHAAAEAALADAGAARWVRFTVTSKTRESFRQDGPTSRARHHLPAHREAVLRGHLRHQPQPGQLQRGQRRLLAADHQRPRHDHGLRARRLPVPAEPRAPPPPAQRHPRTPQPVWIKTIPRIEAIFLCHFIALLDQRPGLNGRSGWR